MVVGILFYILLEKNKSRTLRPKKLKSRTFHWKQDYASSLRSGKKMAEELDGFFRKFKFLKN